MTTSTIQPEQWLGNFGLDQFRPGQKHVIEAIFSGRDTLCIMPTGGGKSLCYQLPAIARDGVTIVISPLIALMKDQVDSLTETGIPATLINSTISSDEQQTRIADMTRGKYKLVYIAPERLRSSSFMRAVQATPIQLLAVDEAHCISQWGHDFRPDYARLGRFRERLGNPQTVALTATATRLVQDDIAKILQLENPSRFVTGFARTNLSITVQSPKANSEKDQKLLSFLRAKQGCGIIYASTRKNCEHLVELLEDQIDRTIAFYHAGLPAESRRQVQEKFMSGDIEIIVATNAFGMGIDKSDLRFVVHYNLPGSIEAYYQEAGRAGRDGKPSDCLMLFSFQDKFIQEFFIENSYPSKEAVREVYAYLCAIPQNPIEMTLQEVKDELGLQIGTTGIATCENLLEKAGAIERLDSRQNAAGIRIDSDLPTLVDFLPRDATTRRHVLRGLESLVGDLRGERVMFQPKWLAQRLDMKWDAVNRSIREIVKLPMVDYVPPFRGRAIHVIDRKKRFSELEIDFSELSRRKQAEYQKLESVIRFANTRRCRQLEILEYFGDPDRKRCGNCDRCDTKTKAKSSNKSFGDPKACLYAAQVALSGVARTHGRFGKTVIAQMLTGSTSKKLAQSGLNRIQTFGLLRALRQSDVVDLFDFLISHGYITQVETTKFRPTLTISESGKSLLSGDSFIDLTTEFPIPLVTRLSSMLKGKEPHLLPHVIDELEPSLDTDEAAKDEPRDVMADGEPSDSSPDDHLQLTGTTDTVFAKSEVRELADSEAIDATLDIDFEMLSSEKGEPIIETTTPVDESDQEKAPLTGRGESDSLQESPVAEDRQNRLTESIVSRITSDLPDEARMQPAYFWTWRLFAVSDYQLGHVCQSRQLDVATVLDHLIQAIEQGYPVQLGWGLSSEVIEKLRMFVHAHPGERLSGILTQIPDGVSPKELLFFAKCEPSR